MGRKKKSILELLIDIIVVFLKLLWLFITFPFRIFKLFQRKKTNQTINSYQPIAMQYPVSATSAPVQATPGTPIYKRKFLLTKHEWQFYNALKPIADRLGLAVLAKIRMADLVETVANTNSEYFQGFAKVKAKHVDFALAKPHNLYIELLIELDDSTHKPGNERDAFVEQVYAAAGYKLLRIRDPIELEVKIRSILGIELPDTVVAQ